MGICLSKAKYGKDTVGPDCGPLQLESPLYCTCCANFYPCCLPKSNSEKHLQPRVLSLAGLTSDERKLWKCVSSGNSAKARELLDANTKKGGLAIACVSAIRLEGGANLLVALATVDYSTFSTESAQFLVDEHHLDINDTSEKTRENALMAALSTFSLLSNIAPCGCCETSDICCCCCNGVCTFKCCCEKACCCPCFVFEQDVRKQHCLELTEYLVEAGIDVDYNGTGATALQLLIDLFCREAACPDAQTAAKTGGFDSKAACLALAENVARRMTQMDYQSDKSAHVLYKLLDAIGIDSALSVDDMKSLINLTDIILRTKTSCLDINCRAKNGKGDNLLCAYILALTTLFAAKEEERLQAVFNPILGFMKFTCANGVDTNFISTQGGCNALLLSLRVIQKIQKPAGGEMVDAAQTFVQFAHFLVERKIDLNHTAEVSTDRIGIITRY